MEVAVETTCGTLLRELQHIWDEMGECDTERDKMLLQLEQECLEVYRRKVDYANHARARLHQAIADAEAELASITSLLGDLPTIMEKRPGTLRNQLSALIPHLEEMRQKRDERAKKFANVKSQIYRIGGELNGISHVENISGALLGEQDLSLRKLEEYEMQLQALQKEKADRLNRIMDLVNSIHGLCAVLSIDFFKTITEVHPSLNEADGQSASVSNETISKLANVVRNLVEEKKERLQKMQDLGASFIELWNLMDTPAEEQHMFRHVTCLLAAAENEVTEQGALALDAIEQAEEEVDRLSQLKISRMKELVLKKRSELEDICRRAHMDADSATSQENLMALIESGVIDSSELLSNIEEQIGKAKEEAYSRKEIMEKIEKWLVACEEESWLEDYNKDENRYSNSRGAHINLKRAEKARAVVNKLPALVETLAIKARAWEEERGALFMYDGVRFLSMLEEYKILRQEKEEEKRRQRDQRRLQEQLLTEQETLFGSRPSPNKTPVSKKSQPRAPNTPANRRLSLGGAMLPSVATDVLAPRINGTTNSRLSTFNSMKENKKERSRPLTTLQPKEDSEDGHEWTSYPAAPIFAQDVLQAPRMPLSPVPLIAAKSNNIYHAEETYNKNQILVGCPVKIALTKSPLSVAPASTIELYHGFLPEQENLAGMECSFEERRAQLTYFADVRI